MVHNAPQSATHVLRGGLQSLPIEPSAIPSIGADWLNEAHLQFHKSDPPEVGWLYPLFSLLQASAVRTMQTMIRLHAPFSPRKLSARMTSSRRGCSETSIFRRKVVS